MKFLQTVFWLVTMIGGVCCGYSILSALEGIYSPVLAWLTAIFCWLGAWFFGIFAKG